jgi:hypothetical protein
MGHGVWMRATKSSSGETAPYGQYIRTAHQPYGQYIRTAHQRYTVRRRFLEEAGAITPIRWSASDQPVSECHGTKVSIRLHSFWGHGENTRACPRC